MAKLPSIRQILVEEFSEQRDWIHKLLNPLNLFMRSIYDGLNKNLTVRDNLQAEIRTIEVESTTPDLKLRKTLNLRPTTIMVGNIQKSDGSDFTSSNAIMVQWSLTAEGGIKITDVVGITPSTSDKYKLTLIIFTE